MESFKNLFAAFLKFYRIFIESGSYGYMGYINISTVCNMNVTIFEKEVTDVDVEIR